MRNRALLRFSLFLAFPLVCIRAGPAHSWKKLPQTQVDVEYKPSENSTLHEPIVVMFSVHNNLKEPVTLTLGAGSTQFFDFRLTTPDGQTFHRYRNPGDEVTIVTIGSGKTQVPAGETFQMPLLMNKWFQFRTPGTYVLTSRLTTDIEVPGEASPQPQNDATVRIVVSPRDPMRLQRVCEELATQVSAAPNAEAAQAPAMELSYVGDPIALPYLSRILSTKKLTYESAIEGLARIGNEDAIGILVSALGEGGAVAESASRALSSLQTKITNPSLKEAVQKAIQESSDRARLDYIQQQIAYLDYRSPNLQRSAIENLAGVQDGLQRAEPVLERLATDPSQPADVRSAAKDALAKLHPNN